MKPDRNGPCPCGSNKKFKHCCIGLHNERIRWDGLEDSLRNKIDEYWKEFYYDKYIDDAMDIYGKKDIDSCADISERRLFFDWFIHDYIIPDKRDTVIRLFISEYEDRFVDELERSTAIAWSNSVFRIFEILDIKRGVGYKVKDTLDDDNELFISNKSSSETVKKYDILYLRPYPIGNITRIAGGVILLPRTHLHYIKDYVLHSFQKLAKQHLSEINSRGSQNSGIANNFDNYLRNESLSIIKYLESLTLTPTLTTPQGDIVVLSKSSFIIKHKRRLISLLDSSKDFAKLEDEGRVIRYDWVEALHRDQFEMNNNKENQYQNEKDLPALPQSHQQLALSTILWVPQNEVEDSLKTKNSRNNNNKNNIKKEIYIPYRVFGNLSISGKNLIIDCLSDTLLKNCNEIIQSLAGKYLTYIGDTYKELPYSNTQTENKEDYYDHQLDNHDIDELEVPDTVKQQIDDYFQNFYENWVTMKIPALGNLTPLEASKTEKGRDMLKEVLRQIENELARSNEEDIYPFPIENISMRLGL
ncbi:MAG: SEC-C metal-binding domain-containing protein [Candidatus Nitrosopolaris sp.]